MKIKYLIVGVAILFGCALVSMVIEQTAKGRIDKQPVFVVGVAADYAPFVSINHNGDYEGFDIDLAYALADRMGAQLELKDMGSMAPLFIALEQGSIDAIMWGISITQERLQKVACVRYTGETSTTFPLIFWGAIPEGVRMLADMKGATVCVEPASAQSAVLSKYEDILTIVPTEKVDDAFLALQQGRVNAALVDPAIAKKFMNTYSEIKVLEIPLQPEDQVYGMGIPIKKENTEMIECIQQAVDVLRQEGTIAALEKKWGIV